MYQKISVFISYPTFFYRRTLILNILNIGSFRGSFYVFARDERGGWTQDWEKIVNRIVRGGRCDV